MTPIPISSCQHCNPDLWKAVKKSKGIYKCQACGKVINEVLERRRKLMNENEKELFDQVMDNVEAEKPKPLYEFHVAGVQHHQLHTCIKEIKVGDCLTMTLEPTNRFDPNAVRIEFQSLNQDKYIMLGHVPKAKGDYSTKVSAAMMIKNLRCEVLELNPEAKTWEQLKVGIFDEDGAPEYEEEVSQR
jgi:hypothetical protein